MDDVVTLHQPCGMLFLEPPLLAQNAFWLIILPQNVAPRAHPDGV